MFSTQEDPSRALALTTSLQHSAELPTFLTPQLPELLQDFFFFLYPETTEEIYQSSRTSVFDHAGDLSPSEAL